MVLGVFRSMGVYLVHPKGLLVRRDAQGEVSLPSAADAAQLGVSASEDLGDGDWSAAFDDAPPEPFVVAGLRELWAALGEASWQTAGRAVQLAEWARTHRFCGRCATPTERVEGERCMRCPSCGLLAYPRISPAVIVLVRRGDEALLARGARFPLPFYSTLAGFVEAGESLEQTVHREIREEVGVEVESSDLLRQPAVAVPPLPHGGFHRPMGIRGHPSRRERDTRCPLVPGPRSTCRTPIPEHRPQAHRCMGGGCGSGMNPTCMMDDPHLDDG